MPNHIEGPEFRATGELSRREIQRDEPAPEDFHQRGRAFCKIMSTLLLRRRTIGSMDTSTPPIACEPQSPAQQGRTETSQLMIKPSIHQRVVIEFRRDDWP